jgi:hypothetical protein
MYILSHVSLVYSVLIQLYGFVSLYARTVTVTVTVTVIQGSL